MKSYLTLVLVLSLTVGFQSCKSDKKKKRSTATEATPLEEGFHEAPDNHEKEIAKKEKQQFNGENDFVDKEPIDLSDSPEAQIGLEHDANEVTEYDFSEPSDD